MAPSLDVKNGTLMGCSSPCKTNTKPMVNQHSDAFVDDVHKGVNDAGLDPLSSWTVHVISNNLRSDGTSIGISSLPLTLGTRAEKILILQERRLVLLI